MGHRQQINRRRQKKWFWPERTLIHDVVVIDDSAAVETGPCVCVPFKKLADSKYENIAALGVVAALLGLDQPVVSEAVIAYFGRKDAVVLEANRVAIEVCHQGAAVRRSGGRLQSRCRRLTIRAIGTRR